MLSKSRFVTGLQCHRLLWWTVHEREAPELRVGPMQQFVFQRGARVGEVAREHFPGGVLIDLPHFEVQARVEATARAVAGGANVVYEAAFAEDGVFVAVDVLHRRGQAWTVTEVKSTSRVKAAHIPDVAIQTHVVRRAGLAVERAEVMILNGKCRHPNLEELFSRQDVSEQVEALMPSLPREAERQRAMLAGPLPEATLGRHCKKPHPCAFVGRCWPKAPEHHVGTLYMIGKKQVERLLASGVETIHALPENAELGAIAQRQRRAVSSGRLEVEPGLGEALAKLELPTAYLDFESIAPAIPRWPGSGPYEPVPVQLSCHLDRGGGQALEHHEWLAEGSGDPRPGFARALLGAVRGARTVVVYNAVFERGRIARLRELFPELARPLRSVERRIVDLLPIVRDHVYHPDFGGSFSLKRVLPALVPGMSHAGLAIHEGAAAAAELERLLLHETELGDAERAELRQALLSYCRLDTLAMLRIVERLRELARG